MASKASFADQQKQVQENIHSQVTNFCTSMEEILRPDVMKRNQQDDASAHSHAAQHQSGLSFAVGKNIPPTNHPGEFTLAILLINFPEVYFKIYLLNRSDRITIFLVSHILLISDFSSSLAS